MLRIAVLTLVAVLAALPNPPRAASADVPSVVLLLASDVPEYATGTPVTFTLAVDNRGDAPVTVIFPSAQLFDVSVRTEQREVWRWAADRDFAQAETERTFPPGVTLLGRVTWDGRDSSGTRLQPGVYQVQATLAVSPRQPGNVLLISLVGV